MKKFEGPKKVILESYEQLEIGIAESFKKKSEFFGEYLEKMLPVKC